MTKARDLADFLGSGADIAGTISADGLTVDGSSTFNTSGTGILNYNYIGANKGGVTTDGINVYQNAVANMYFNVNSANRMVIEGSGNVGIATNSPQTSLHIGTANNKSIRLDTASNNATFFSGWQDAAQLGVNRDPASGVFTDGTKAAATIAVVGEAGNSYIVFNTTGTNNTAPPERMRIDAAGAVGIGTSSPSEKLHVVGTIVGQSNDHYFGNYSSGAYVDIGNLATSEMWLDTRSSTLTDVPLNFRTKGSGAIKFTVGVSERLRIDSSGNVGVTEGAKVYFGGTTDPSSHYIKYNSGNNGLELHSYGSTIFTNTSGTERMRIDSSGNVGIGTSSPNAVVTSAPRKGGVPTASSVVTALSMFNDQEAVTGDGVRILFDHSYRTPGAGSRGAAIDSIGTTNYSGAVDLRFLTSSGDTLSEKMRLDSSGNLLVGTTSKPTISSEGNGVYLEDTVNGDAAFAVKANGAWFRAKSDVGPGWGYSGFQGFDSAGTYQWGITTNGTSAIQFINSGSEKMRLDASGRVMIGVTTPLSSSTLSVNGDVSGLAVTTYRGSTSLAYHFIFENGSGQVGGIGTNGSSTFFATSSDYRLKEDVQPMVGASDRVLALNPVNFAWKIDGTRVDGFLAHEAQAVVPEAITGERDAVDADGKPIYQRIDQSKLVPLLTAALQEALGRITALEAEVASLKA